MYEDPRPHIRKQANDTLRYTIDGTIISKNSSGHGTPPREFQDALKAFRNLFKDNLKTILSSSMISAAMGPKYANDPLANKPYTVEDR